MVAGNLVNVVLEVLFVYGFGWGIEGSAWGTVVAQAGMGAAFGVTLWRAARRGSWPPGALIRRVLVIGRHIFVRTAALLASFVVASAVLARMGDAPLGAHQIVFQLWFFLALVLDAIAIAGQVIVGRRLGAGDADGAFAASARMIWLAMVVGAVFAAVLLAVEPFLPLVFTGDDQVLERVHEVWWLFALMQPLNGAVFALDGILIGAGDGRYLMWSMLAAFAVSTVLALAALALDWGIVGVWWALVALILVRLVTLGAASAGAAGSSRAGRELLLPVPPQPRERLPQRRRELVDSASGPRSLELAARRGRDELVLLHPLPDPLGPEVEELSRTRARCGVVDDAEVRKGEPLRPAPFDLVECPRPRLEVDVRRRRYGAGCGGRAGRGRRPRRRRAAFRRGRRSRRGARRGRGWGSTRARGRARRRRARSSPGPARARPRACRRRRRRGGARSRRVSAGRRGAVPRSPTRAPGARVLADEHPRRAAVVEVDVRQQQVADVGEAEAALGEARLRSGMHDVGPQSTSAGPSSVSTR